MDDVVKNIIESGILEEYALGMTDNTQSQEVEKYLQDYPEVRKAYDDIQTGIENFAKLNAIPPPANLKAKILNSIEGLSGASTPGKSSNLWSYIMGAAALVFLVFGFLNWNKLKSVNSDLVAKTGEMDQLKTDCDEKTAEITALRDQLLMINNPDTERVLLAGNNLAPGFKSMAYWNKEEKESFIHVVAMPELPNKQCYQLWADVDGEMISLGVIKVEEGILASLPFLENAESLNITIEPDGGSDHPNVSNLIASQVI